MPALADEVARGRVRGWAVRGLGLRGADPRPLLQRPELLDFARGRGDLRLSKP